MPELATYQGRMDVAKAREWWRTGKYLGGMIVEGETKDVCVTVSNIVNNLFAAYEELTAANLDLTERVLYTERERDEAVEQEAAVEKERRHWYDLCGKANVRVNELTAELAWKDAALEWVAADSKDPMTLDVVKTALEAK